MPNRGDVQYRMNVNGVEEVFDHTTGNFRPLTPSEQQSRQTQGTLGPVAPEEQAAGSEGGPTYEPNPQDLFGSLAPSLVPPPIVIPGSPEVRSPRVREEWTPGFTGRQPGEGFWGVFNLENWNLLPGSRTTGGEVIQEARPEFRLESTTPESQALASALANIYSTPRPDLPSPSPIDAPADRVVNPAYAENVRRTEERTGQQREIIDQLIEDMQAADPRAVNKWQQLGAVMGQWGTTGFENWGNVLHTFLQNNRDAGAELDRRVALLRLQGLSAEEANDQAIFQLMSAEHEVTETNADRAYAHNVREVERGDQYALAEYNANVAARGQDIQAATGIAQTYAEGAREQRGINEGILNALAQDPRQRDDAYAGLGSVLSPSNEDTASRLSRAFVQGYQTEVLNQWSIQAANRAANDPAALRRELQRQGINFPESTLRENATPEGMRALMRQLQRRDPAAYEQFINSYAADYYPPIGAQQ